MSFLPNTDLSFCLFQIIQACSNLIDDKRVFLSEIRDDNPLDCLLQKLQIVRVPLDVRNDDIFSFLIIIALQFSVFLL